MLALAPRACVARPGACVAQERLSANALRVALPAPPRRSRGRATTRPRALALSEEADAEFRGGNAALSLLRRHDALLNPGAHSRSTHCRGASSVSLTQQLHARWNSFRGRDVPGSAKKPRGRLHYCLQLGLQARRNVPPNLSRGCWRPRLAAVLRRAVLLPPLRALIAVLPTRAPQRGEYPRGARCACVVIRHGATRRAGARLRDCRACVHHRHAVPASHCDAVEQRCARHGAHSCGMAWLLRVRLRFRVARASRSYSRTPDPLLAIGLSATHTS